MLKFFSKLHFLINITIKIYNIIPMPIINNLELVKAYRKIFFYLNFENIEGDYLEFGVYEGSSMISAYYANKSTSKVDNIVITKRPPERKFIGFDSFEKGFKYFVKEDKHENWYEGLLQSSYIKTKKKIEKISKNSFFLVNGFIEQTIPEIKKNKNMVEGHQINKIAAILIDVDLKSPALEALKFCKNKLQKGSIIIIDNYFYFKGDKSKGERGALIEAFKDNNVTLEEFGNYGISGKIFIVLK